MTATTPRRLPTGVRWLIGLGVTAVLLAGLAVAGEFLARAQVESIVAAQVRDLLELEAEHPVSVAVEDGAVLPQLLSNRLSRLVVGVDDVTVGPVHGSASAVLTDVPVAGGGDLGSADAELRIDAASVAGLGDNLSGLPVDDISLAGSEVRFSTRLELLGLGIDVGVGVTPGAEAGEITFAPTTILLGDAAISADDLRDRFGGLADELLDTRSLCIADRLPVGLTVTDARVESQELVATVTASPGIIADAAQQELGSCS